MLRVEYRDISESEQSSRCPLDEADFFVTQAVELVDKLVDLPESRGSQETTRRAFDFLWQTHSLTWVPILRLQFATLNLPRELNLRQSNEREARRQKERFTSVWSERRYFSLRSQRTPRPFWFKTYKTQNLPDLVFLRDLYVLCERTHVQFTWRDCVRIARSVRESA